MITYNPTNSINSINPIHFANSSIEKIIIQDVVFSWHEQILLSFDELILANQNNLIQDIALNSTSLGVIGESGSGKTLLSYGLLGVLGYLNPEIEIKGRVSIFFHPIKTQTQINTKAKISQNPIEEFEICLKSLNQSSQKIQNQLKAHTNREYNRFASMIFQEPLSAFNPTQTILNQLLDVAVLHQNKVLAIKRIKSNCSELNLSEDLLTKYPHQLSGGQRQRFLAILAILQNSLCLIADEPTTALDEQSKNLVINFLQKHTHAQKQFLIFISHDLDVIQKLCQQTIVLKKGAVIEMGATQKVLQTPNQNYTKDLVKCYKQNHAKKETSHAINQINSINPVILRANNLSICYPQGLSWQLPKNKSQFKKLGFQRQFNWVQQELNFSIVKGQTLALMGESGVGKSSIAQAILGLTPYSGSILFEGQVLKNHHPDIQVLFQDPFSSLSPRQSIQEILEEGLIHHQIMDANTRAQKIKNMLSHIELDEDILNKKPHEFSGGQRQRIALARSLILQPKLLILDEPTSALDYYTAEKLIFLLKKLQTQHQLSYLLITHDADLAYTMADETLYLKKIKN